jgi:hypothetical protein
MSFLYLDYRLNHAVAVALDQFEGRADFFQRKTARQQRAGIDPAAFEQLDQRVATWIGITWKIFELWQISLQNAGCP